MRIQELVSVLTKNKTAISLGTMNGSTARSDGHQPKPRSLVYQLPSLDEMYDLYRVHGAFMKTSINFGEGKMKQVTLQIMEFLHASSALEMANARGWKSFCTVKELLP